LLFGDVVAKARFSNESTYRKFVEGGREQEFDMLFENAVKEVQRSFGGTYPMYIGGKPVNAGETITERSPIDFNMVLGNFQNGTREHTLQAISAAQRAFPSWGATDYKERAALFRKAAELFAKERFRLAAILSYENAKSRYESIGEVDEAIDFMRYYASELEANKGYKRNTSEKKSSAKESMGFQGAPPGLERISIELKPYGVFGVIAPFNFPISISVGMSVGAMITGNTVVFKPSSEKMTMLTGLKIYELFKAAGIPDGVFNYVTGPGSVIGAELAANDNVAGIAFTGSREIGMGMLSKNLAAGKQKVFILEMGGKNPAIVTKNAAIEKAVEGVASAAFGFAGQKCSALSRLYVHESIKELFVSKLIEKLRTLKVGNPLEKANYIGPLIGESAYVTYQRAVEKARKEGRILYGGNRVNIGLQGYYVEPTLIEVMHSSDLVHRELFVPILTVEGFKGLDDAIAMANDTEYGLTAGFYGKSKKDIDQFCDRILAGVVYVNRGISATTGAMVGHHTFVGWKGSGLTGKGTGSKLYLQQFMHEKSISITK
jgi:1-pyrroline-5-carboxylate dehydrogenase